MKVKAYIHVHQYEWDDKPSIIIYSHDASQNSGGLELLEVREIDIELPADFSLQALRIRQLEKERQKVIDDYHKTIARIDDQIKKFQCLEMSK